MNLLDPAGFGGPHAAGNVPLVHRASDTAAKLIAAQFPPLLLDAQG